VDEVVRLVVTKMGAQECHWESLMGGHSDTHGGPATPSSTTTTCGGEVATAGRDMGAPRAGIERVGLCRKR
jgi:hypothetical protein